MCGLSEFLLSSGEKLAVFSRYPVFNEEIDRPPLLRQVKILSKPLLSETRVRKFFGSKKPH